MGQTYCYSHCYLICVGSILEKFSEKVKEYMRENMPTVPKKKTKDKDKKKKDKDQPDSDQPSSAKDSSEKASIFDQFDRGRNTAHKKAVVPGEAEDQPPSASQKVNQIYSPAFSPTSYNHCCYFSSSQCCNLLYSHHSNHCLLSRHSYYLI